MSCSVSLVRCGESERAGGIRPAIGSPQLGAKTGTTIAIRPVRASPPKTVSQAARFGFGTWRFGTATDSANRIAPTSRPQKGAHATKGEVSAPNADGIADMNRL